MSLVFDEATHSYFFNGINIPSVTRTLDHAGLVSFYAIREEVLERKGRLGTKVHQACEYYDQDDLDWTSLDEEVKPRVDAWANFRAETGFVPRRIEKRYVATVNGMNFGLTVDREGFFKKDEAIIDLKTSTTVAEWSAIQTAGYALGVPDIEGKVISPLTLFYRRRRMIVQLLETGKYKKFDYQDRQDANIFISALHISWWKLQHGATLRKIEEAA